MKRIIFLLSIMFCSVAFAHTIEWYVGDTLLSTTTCESGDNITPPTVPEKFGYHFVMWEPKYTRIEYLESTGTQCIIMYVGTYGQNKILEAAIEYPEFFNWGTSISITNNSSGSSNQINPNSSIWWPYINGNNINNNVNVQTNTKYNVQFNCISGDTKYYANNFLVAQSSETYVVGNRFCLFGSYNTNSATCQNFAKVKFYYTKIYENNILIADIIPALDENGTPCMYDKVTKQFFYNQGTGNFIAGPVIGE